MGMEIKRVSRDFEFPDPVLGRFHVLPLKKGGASSEIRRLSAAFKMELPHLKRVRDAGKQLLFLLARKTEEKDVFIARHKGELQRAGCCPESITEATAPISTPQTREQYMAFSAVWPCTFKPLPPPEEVEEAALRRISEILCGVFRESGPEPPSSANPHECAEIAVVMDGEQFSVHRSGDRDVLSRHPALEAIRIQSRDTAGYLCTGKDILLDAEPCLMCAMALVHGRTRRLFFLPSRSKDAPITSHHINQLLSLNHRFECYEVLWRRR